MNTSEIAPIPPKLNKIDEQTASLEFDRFCESMDLDVDVNFMDEEDLNLFNKQKRRIVGAICNGSLVINDNGEPVYSPKNISLDAPLTFHERTGASIIAMDGKKKNSSVAQMYAVMGEMTKVHPATFAKLKGLDIKICEAIFTLLMD